MPIYEYNCTSCKKIFEKVVPMADREKLQNCSYCAGSGFKIISATRSVLDGTDPAFPGAYDKWARKHENYGHLKPK